MNFNTIFLGARSLSIELENKDIYNSKAPYELYVNGELYKKGSKNIISIFGLFPNTEYELNLVSNGVESKKTIKTKEEYVTLNVLDFGAYKDGKTISTQYIQAAINACPDNGRIYFPKGDYLTGPLFLRSNTTIELAKGARLVGDTNRNNYPKLPGMIMTTDETGEYNLGSWEGNPLDCYASIITGINVSNVNIIGEGTIDGNAQNSDWWVDVRTKRGSWRPRGVFLNHCNNIVLQGVKVCNTPSWNLHPYFSDDLKFIDLEIENPKDSPNTDGCDPESCKNVDILGVHFSVGDDCIAVKSGKIYMGKTYKKPCENLNVRNCSMNFGHGSVVLGSEMSGGIKNMKVSQCLFNQTDRGLRIKTRRGRGKDAIIDGVTFENIEMDDVLTPLVINMFYFCDPDGKTEYVWSKEKLPVDDRTPYLGKFVFKDINCTNVNVAAGAFYGIPEMPIEEIDIVNVKFQYSDNPKEGVPAMMTGLDPMKGKGLLFNYVNKVKMENVEFIGLKDKDVECNEVKSLKR